LDLPSSSRHRRRRQRIDQRERAATPIVGDIAYCARCCSSFELACGDDLAAMVLPPEFALI
jgi:hypothetical protein